MVAALTRSSAIDLTAAARFGPADRASPSRRRERAWVRGAQAGSHEAMEALFRAHWGRAHRAAFLIVQDAAAAEDIAQEAFVAATARFTDSIGGSPSAPGCTASSSTARSTGREPARCAARSARRTTGRPRPSAQPPGRVSWSPRSPPSIPTSAPPWCCAICSSTHPARSPRCSRFPAARSTRACGGRGGAAARLGAHAGRREGLGLDRRGGEPRTRGHPLRPRVATGRRPSAGRGRGRVVLCGSTGPGRFALAALFGGGCPVGPVPRRSRPVRAQGSGALRASVSGTSARS
jgi:hypothetical protein